MANRGQDAVNAMLRGPAYPGNCLRATRGGYGDVPAKYTTARKAQDAVALKDRHPITDVNKIPVGVPIFMGGNHVAMSSGNGKMVSTNSALKNDAHPRQYSIQSWVNTGEYPLHFWSETLNGVRVYDAPKPKARHSKYVTTARVNVRKSPGMKGEIDRVIPAGYHFNVVPGWNITKDGHEWVKTTAGHYIARDGIKKLS